MFWYTIAPNRDPISGIKRAIETEQAAIPQYKVTKECEGQ